MLDKSRDPPDILVGRGALTSLRRDLLAAMADQQVQKQGNVVQRLGEMSAAKSSAVCHADSGRVPWTLYLILPN